jgi:hypothetical protein
LPCSAPDSQSQYWTTSGLSRPRDLFSFATWDGVAFWPRMVAAGSLFDKAPRPYVMKLDRTRIGSSTASPPPIRPAITRPRRRRGGNASATPGLVSSATAM